MYAVCSKSSRRSYFFWTIRARLSQLWPTRSVPKLASLCPGFVKILGNQGIATPAFGLLRAAQNWRTIDLIAQQKLTKRATPCPDCPEYVSSIKYLRDFPEYFLEITHSGRSGQGIALFVNFCWATRAPFRQFWNARSGPKLASLCPDSLIFSWSTGKTPSISANSEWAKTDGALPWLSRKKFPRGDFGQTS